MRIQKDDLMDLYGGFCRSEASKYAAWADHEDLFSAAVLGLFEAYACVDVEMLAELDESDGRAVFLAHAAHYIGKELKAQAAQSGIAMSGHYDNIFGADMPERVGMDVAAMAGNADGVGCDADIVDTLMGLLDEFDEVDPRHVTVFWGAYIHGASDERIGELLGMSKQRACEMRLDMLEKLRRAYAATLR